MKNTKKKQDLLRAAKKVMALSAKRRKRMAVAKKVKADDAFPAIEEETAEAAPPAFLAEEEEAIETAPEAAPAPAAEAAPVEEEEIADVIPTPADAEQNLAEDRAPMAASAKAKTKADSVGGLPPANGGFEGQQLAKAKDSADLGEEDFGYSIPKELEQAVEDGQAETPDDESFQPGVLVPPGLEDAVMAVADPATLGEADSDIRFDLVPFAPEEATTAAEVLNAGAHWVLFANGDPVAKINLQDQDNADRIAAHFVSEDYARSVIQGIQAVGLHETLASTKAKPYVAKIDENAKIAEITARLESEAKESLRALTADAKSKFVENLALVLEASASNFIVENPLKDSIVAVMTSAGWPEPAAAEAVDNAFFQHGVKTLAGFLDKAEEWANYTPEAQSELKATLEQAGRRARPLPSQLTPAQTNPDYDQNLANRMAASAIPVQQPAVVAAASSTSALDPSPAAGSDKDAYRAKFGKFRTY